MDANLFSSAKWNYSTDYDLIIEIRKSQEIMFPGFYFLFKSCYHPVKFYKLFFAIQGN